MMEKRGDGVKCHKNETKTSIFQMRQQYSRGK